jgi:hypothetical protein
MIIKLLIVFTQGQSLLILLVQAQSYRKSKPAYVFQVQSQNVPSVSIINRLFNLVNAYHFDVVIIDLQ